MIVFLNGQFVSETEAVISVHDRGFLYGDGLFETIRVEKGRPFRLGAHLARLAEGAAGLRINLPFLLSELEAQALTLLDRNQLSPAILRITLSRGCGARGYSPRGADRSTLVMTQHPAPVLDAAQLKLWSVITATVRVPAGDVVAGWKSANKLVNIIARMEAEERGADEALLLNTRGEVAEAASANVFWIKAGQILTPPLAAGILPGITREVVRELAVGLGLHVREASLLPEALREAEGIFLTQSSYGVIGVRSCDGIALGGSALIERLHRAYCALLQSGEDDFPKATSQADGPGSRQNGV